MLLEVSIVINKEIARLLSYKADQVDLENGLREKIDKLEFANLNSFIDSLQNQIKNVLILNSEISK